MILNNTEMLGKYINIYDIDKEKIIRPVKNFNTDTKEVTAYLFGQINGKFKVKTKAYKINNYRLLIGKRLKSLNTFLSNFKIVKPDPGITKLIYEN